MPRATSVLEYAAEFTPEEFERISRGLIPQEMEDKWFIYLEGDVLNFHRSWSGTCIYRVDLATVGEKLAVDRVLVNRDRGQYRATDNAYDAEVLHFLISNLLLGRQVEFPMRAGLGSPEGLFQNYMTGTALPEKSAEEAPLED